MAANTRFAVAVHTLGMLAFGDELNVTSDDVAKSVGTNPVVVRRLLAQLTRQGLVTVKLGAAGGARLTRSPEQITLADIYRALDEGPLFQVPMLGETHECAVGRNVGPVLTGVLLKAEKGLLAELRTVTLADVIGKVMRRMKREGCVRGVPVRTRKKK
ncbi:MAG: Rrf2 family transcriptional regulator [Rubrivivax sp.]|nr:Rrf2 family transcriptional regulator [Pyrinomonadaceae bacterium]